MSPRDGNQMDTSTIEKEKGGFQLLWWIAGSVIAIWAVASAYGLWHGLRG